MPIELGFKIYASEYLYYLMLKPPRRIWLVLYSNQYKSLKDFIQNEAIYATVRSYATLLFDAIL